MREILFRGKRTDNGEWVEGYFVKARWYLDESEIVGIMPLDLALYPHSEFSSYCEVNPDTVGQFTGLTDKNGKKIFEGDIIKADNWLHRNMKIYTVVFENCGFYAKYKDEDSWNFDHLENIEIIGNIHDNPELL